MQTAISLTDIKKQLLLQLSSLFTISDIEKDLITKKFGDVLLRCEKYFSHDVNKYYSVNGETYFDPYHSAQYTIFLYYFSNSIFRETGDYQLASKLYYLNKIMNACDLFYEVELPEIFSIDHPVGSVMGRASYGNNFSFSQNCTVGNNNGLYPVIGENVLMCANSLIIGNCHIGNGTIIGAGCLIKDENISENRIVFGQSPNLMIKIKHK